MSKDVPRTDPRAPGNFGTGRAIGLAEFGRSLVNDLEVAADGVEELGLLRPNTVEDISVGILHGSSVRSAATKAHDSTHREPPRTLRSAKPPRVGQTLSPNSILPYVGFSIGRGPDSDACL